MQRTAPDFTLPNQNGQLCSLKDFIGRWLVVYFYPHDNALGCTKEACSFRDEYRIIQQFGNAAVIGINQGSVESHRKFAARHHLNFPILSDKGHKVTMAFGAWRSNKAPVMADRFFGTRRNSYLINPAGKIVKEYLGVDPAEHVALIISDLQARQKIKTPITR